MGIDCAFTRLWEEERKARKKRRHMEEMQMGMIRERHVRGHGSGKKWGLSIGGGGILMVELECVCSYAPGLRTLGTPHP